MSTCSSAEGSAGDGGGLWLFGNSSAALTDCEVSLSTAVGSGGAAFVGSGSSATLINVAVDSNSASLGAGGAVLLSGSASSLSLQNSSFTSNEAFIGGFLGFESGATPSNGALRMAGLRLDGNRAQAGALYGIKDSARAFEDPQCTSCEIGVSNRAVSYGNVSATPPADMRAFFPAVTRTGDSCVVNASITDGFAQPVANFTGLLGELDCLSQTIFVPGAAPVVRPCTPSALRGSVRAVYACAPAPLLAPRLLDAPTVTTPLTPHQRADPFLFLTASLRLCRSDGVARFFPVFLSGEPRSVFTLAVSLVVLPGEGVAALLGAASTLFVNISVAPCGYLEEFVGLVYGSGASTAGPDVCSCKYGAVRDSAGECACGPNFMTLGPAAGSRAALEDPGAASCNLLTLVRDSSAAQRRITIVATVCTVVPVVLIVLGMAFYLVEKSHQITQQTIQQLMIPEDELAIVVWGDGTLAEVTMQIGGAELTAADILSNLPAAVRASTLLQAVRVTFRGTRVWLEQAATPNNRRMSATARTSDYGTANYSRDGSVNNNSVTDPRMGGRAPTPDPSPSLDAHGQTTPSDRRVSAGGRGPRSSETSGSEFRITAIFAQAGVAQGQTRPQLHSKMVRPASQDAMAAAAAPVGGASWGDLAIEIPEATGARQAASNKYGTELSPADSVRSTRDIGTDLRAPGALPASSAGPDFLCDPRCASSHG